MVHPFVWAVRRTSSLFLGAAFGLATVGAFGAPVHAQAGTVSGTVVDSKSGRPLADARVAVDGGGRSRGLASAATSG